MAVTILMLGGSVSNARAAGLVVVYSSLPGDTPPLTLRFVGNRLVSDTIRVRFDAEPAFTPLTTDHEIGVTFVEDSILQRVRNAAAMRVEVNLLHQGHTTLTFSLRGSAKAMDSAKAACWRGE